MFVIEWDIEWFDYLGKYNFDYLHLYERRVQGLFFAFSNPIELWDADFCTISRHHNMFLADSQSSVLYQIYAGVLRIKFLLNTANVMENWDWFITW